jgi:hypothetical protein
MTIYRYVLSPLEFIIESDCDTPETALYEALQCRTANETGLLKYLHSNIEDYPTLDECVECIDISED